MRGFKPGGSPPIRKKLSNEHWLAINCSNLDLDARREFCVWAEEYVAEEMNGEVTNISGEADTILYDVHVSNKDIYVSVKSSSNASSVRDCIARSRVKASPLRSGIEMRDQKELFTQVYLHYIPHDREICWFQTSVLSFKELEIRYTNGNLTIDNQGRLSSSSHDIIFGEPELKKIIDLPEIDEELEELKSEVIKRIKKSQQKKVLREVQEILHF